MCLGTQHILICGVALESQKKRELGLSTDRYFFASRALGWASSPFFAIIFLNIVDLFAGHALNRNFDLRVQSVLKRELWVSKSADAKSDAQKICEFVHPLHQR